MKRIHFLIVTLFACSFANAQTEALSEESSDKKSWKITVAEPERIEIGEATSINLYSTYGGSGNLDFKSGYNHLNGEYGDINFIGANHYRVEMKGFEVNPIISFVRSKDNPSSFLKFGIGTENPQAKLEISETNGSTFRLSSTNTNAPTGSLAGKIDFFKADPSTGGAGVVSSIQSRAYDLGGAYALDFATGSVGGSNAINTKMTIDYNGRVGIGTTTPEEKLHVFGGTASIEGNIGTLPVGTRYWRGGKHTLELANSDKGDVVMSFHRAGESNAAIVHSTNGGLTFTGNGNSSNPHMYVASNGNIGIGTTSPQSLFHISGLSTNPNTNTDVMAILTNTRYNSTDVTGENKLVFGWANHYAAGIAAYKTSSNITGLKFITEYGYNKELEAMTISGIGNVGIGTTNPTERLEVNGNFKVDNKNTPYSTFRIGHEANDAIIADNSGATYGGGYFFRVHDELVGHKYRDVMMLTQNGNVGIGVLKPTAKLDVNGNIKVNGTSLFKDNLSVDGSIRIGTTKDHPAYKLSIAGKVQAEEIKVHTGWSDFVFYDDYKLPTLKEVEAHIQEKGHLKDIPSAEVVAKDGIFLGEMNSKLLQKIEELTLYTIAQEKKIDLLLKRMEQLEASK